MAEAEDTTGQAGLASHADEANAMHFMMHQYMAQVQTAMPVEVITVYGGGAVETIGRVDVRPLVHQQDGAGDTMPHSVIYGLPYSRAQGGRSSIIIDPKPGDIGVVVVASRDITKVKQTGSASSPDSRRRFSLSDGMYMGGMLNKPPSQYIRFINDNTLEIVSPANLTLNAPDVIATQNLHVGTGASGTFSTPTGQIVTVRDGIIVNIF